VKRMRDGLAEADDGDDGISGEGSELEQTDEGMTVMKKIKKGRVGRENDSGNPRRLCPGSSFIVSLARGRAVQGCTRVYLSFAPVCDLDQMHANDKRRPALFTGVTDAEHPLVYILNPSLEESIPNGPRIYVVPSSFMRKTEERKQASKTALQRYWKSANRVPVAPVSAWVLWSCQLGQVQGR